jgi:diguanylate cyclase (GGDEF)-like protein/PAS domain S-box-containing protein
MLSFRVQSVLVVALAVIGVSAGLIFVQAQSIRNQTIAERNASASRVVASLQQSANYAADSGGRDFQRADLVRRLPEVQDLIGARRVTIFDSAGAALADTGPGEEGDFDHAPVVAEVLASGAPATINRSPTTRVQAVPFRLAGGENGVLAVHIDVQPMLDSIAEATRNSLLSSLLVLLATIPLTVFVSNRVLARTYEREQRLRVEARFGSLVRNSSDLLLIVSPDHRIGYVSPSVERVLGFRQEQLHGRAVEDLIHPDDQLTAVALIRRVPGSAGPSTRVEWRIRHRDGSWRDFELACTDLTGDPTVAGVVLNGRDISERKALEEQLTHQAFHDPLTGLANRALFKDRVDQALVRASRRGSSVAVIFLDLDDFKTVNDSLGHHAGDRLLADVAERLQGALRTSDTIARLGGDEFAVLLEEADDSEVQRTAERAVTELRAPFAIEGQQVFVSASIGIALGSSGLNSAPDLLRGADMALYAAKSRGKGEVRVFDRTMHQDLVSRLELDAELRRAIDHDELVVHYQPIVALGDATVVGFEALVRWQHPVRGLILPGLFIQFADDSGMIDAIGRLVLDRACRQLRIWQETHPGRPLTMGVNLSARQLDSDSVVEMVRDAIDATGVAASSVIIEITEGTLMQDVEATLRRLVDLKKLGVRLAIDDFGTGYSSLSYLRRFPVDVLKIDRSFVEHVAARTDAMALTRAIVELARSLRIRAVAEGVETAAQAAELRSLGCDYGQGYLFGPPMAPAAAEALLRAPVKPVRTSLARASAPAGGAG